MKNEKRAKKNCIMGIVGGSLLAAGFFLMLLARVSGTFAHWYSTHIYRIWVNTTGRIMGVFPFSVSEILLYLLLLWILVSMCRLMAGVIRKKKERRQVVEWCMKLLFIAGALFFLYVVNCGINYQRESFAESAGIRIEEYSVEELTEVCSWLTKEVNARSDEVPRDDAGIMTLENISDEEDSTSDGGKTSVDTLAVEAMKGLGDIYPELSGFYPKPKGLLNSWILSIQNLTGVYSPFTVEANYNSDVVDYYIPFTACHELSHLRGFMQEQEANFIAFLACTESEYMEFQYSGYLVGWVYCMNVLHQVDYDAWEEVRADLDLSADADLKANSEFWAAYDGKVAEVSNKVNDTYLKANGQKDGVESYDRMVDLIVAIYQEGER